MSTKRKSTPIRLRKKTTRGVMLDLTAKYAEAVTKLAALEQRVERVEDWRQAHDMVHAIPAPAEERGDCDACAGSGETLSGKPCVCGGSGKAADAQQGLREELVKMEERADRAETQLADTDAYAKKCREAVTTANAERDAALREIGDQARRYEAQLSAIRKAMGGYPDSDLVSLATSLKENSDALDTALSDAATARGECDKLRSLIEAVVHGTRVGHNKRVYVVEPGPMEALFALVALSSSPTPATGEKKACLRCGSHEVISAPFGVCVCCGLRQYPPGGFVGECPPKTPPQPSPEKQRYTYTGPGGKDPCSCEEGKPPKPECPDHSPEKGQGERCGGHKWITWTTASETSPGNWYEHHKPCPGCPD